MPHFEPLPPEVDRLAKVVVNAAFNVHKNLGPGLLESVYEKCLSYEFQKAGLVAYRQIPVPIIYDGVHIDTDYRLDFLVADKLIVEVKAVECLLPVHEAQILTYLKLTNVRLGLLVNFNVPLIKDGIRRIIL